MDQHNVHHEHHTSHHAAHGAHHQTAHAHHRKRKDGKKGLYLLLLLALLMSFMVGGCFLFSKMSSRPAVKSKKTFIEKMPNGHFRLVVNGEPYVVMGVCYQPIPPGQDYTYNWWGDPAKPWLVDGQLMKDASINTVRFYQPGESQQETRQVVSDLFQKFGIRTIMGHNLGIYDIPPPNYADEGYRQQVKEEVLAIVKAYKDEPGILFWLLGNENNYSFDDQIAPWGSDELDNIEDPKERANAKAKLYYSFVNDIAKEIKKIDPNHPVAMGNGEVFFLDIANTVTPDIDILGLISYRGMSFGNTWEQANKRFGKPIVLTEFGCDRYNALTKKEDEDIQVKFLISQWKEILRNTCGKTGKGTVLGGCIFEWNDEWWKHDAANPASWYVQDETAGWTNGAYYFDIEVEGHMNMNEEWYGIVGMSLEKENGVNKRVPKKAYYALKELWAKGCDTIEPPREGKKPN
ncbi:MAG: glycoside hydrolase family 2 TIM barrel-domain containing protein [Candidatus Omnitrophica bacterium]|nr:glycoside hydrolase family 2 TIM barrel-domain containing protein [Candidatus Omnitrophota bacterium]